MLLCQILHVADAVTTLAAGAVAVAASVASVFSASAASTPHFITDASTFAILFITAFLKFSVTTYIIQIFSTILNLALLDRELFSNSCSDGKMGFFVITFT